MTNSINTRQRARALKRAILHMVKLGSIWALGALAVLQFPVFTDPLAVIDKPVRYVVVMTVISWIEWAICEVILSTAHGADYVPASSLRLSPYRRITEYTRTRPAHIRNGCACLLVVASLPILLVVTTTTILSYIWALFVAATTTVHLINARKRHNEWRKNRHARA